MHITLDRNSAQPLYAQLAQNIQQRIRSGALPVGARLPTVRELAHQLGVTRLTVHSAYSELQAGGWVEATVGRGTFVAAREPLAISQDFGREFSAHGLINDMMRLTQVPGMRSLAMADAAPDFAPLGDFQRALNQALAGGASAFAYGSSQGDALLREALSDMLRGRGLHTGADELVVTSGVTQGLALITRVLAQRGDTVVIEQPTYLGVLNVLGHQGVRMLGVPVDQEGMQVEALETLLANHRPRFIYTIPVFQNPSGVCLSPARRAALLALAARYHTPIVEDDIYGQLVYEGSAPAALQADDRDGLVLHMGSLSKSLLPGLRLGYVAAAPAMIERLIKAKQADDLCSPQLLQRALGLFIQQGRLATHLRRVLPQYRARRDAMLAALDRYFPANLHWTTPRGGFSVWVTLPPTVSATDLYLAAVEQGVAFVPGDVFFNGPPPRSHIRLSFSSQPPEVISEVVAVLGGLLERQVSRRQLTRTTTTAYVPLV